MEKALLNRNQRCVIIHVGRCSENDMFKVINIARTQARAILMKTGTWTFVVLLQVYYKLFYRCSRKQGHESLSNVSDHVQEVGTKIGSDGCRIIIVFTTKELKMSD